MIEVDEGVGWPELLAQLIAANHIPASAQKKQKYVEGSTTELDDSALLPQLASPAFRLK